MDTPKKWSHIALDYLESTMR